MSMNIHLQATIEATLPNGKKRELCEHFDLCQTPTEVSYQIEKVDNKLEAYLTWLRGVVTPYKDEIYADDDVFQERSPVGHKMVDDYPEMEKELREWLASHGAEGWTIEWYVA